MSCREADRRRAEARCRWQELGAHARVEDDLGLRITDIARRLDQAIAESFEPASEITIPRPLERAWHYAARACHYPAYGLRKGLGI